MLTENLTTKNIGEFTEKDTIYLRYKTGVDNSQFFRCQFIKFDGGRVYGKAIDTDVNPLLWSREIEKGFFIDNKLEKAALYGKQESDKGYGHFHYFDALGFACYPESEQNDILHQTDHPSYGIMKFVRSQSSKGHSLFGSTLKHSDIITLTISKGELNRGDLNYDSYYAKEHLMEINMSESQFAELITTFNRGSGVPVTISWIDGKHVEPCPFVSKTEQFNAEFKQKMKNLTDDLQKMVAKTKIILESAKPISKGEREIIAGSISSLVSAISSNLPFINEQFAEQMDKTVSEAKASLEAFFVKRSKELGVGGVERKPIEIE